MYVKPLKIWSFALGTIASVLVLISFIGFGSGADFMNPDQGELYLHPEDSGTFPLSISNHGNETQEVDLFFDFSANSTDWVIDLPESITVEPNSSEDVTLSITAPARAIADQYLLTVNAVVRGSDEADSCLIVVQVNQTYGINASIIMHPLGVSPGRAFGIVVRIDNMGNGYDLVTVRAEAPGTNRTGEMVRTANRTVSLPPFGNSSVQIIANLSARAIPGEAFDVIINVTSFGGPTMERRVRITIDEYDIWIRDLHVPGLADDMLASDAIPVEVYIGSMNTLDDDLGDLSINVYRTDGLRGPILDLMASKRFHIDGTTWQFGHTFKGLPFESYRVVAVISYKGVSWQNMTVDLNLIRPLYSFEIRAPDSPLEEDADVEEFTFEIEVVNTGNVKDDYLIEVLTDYTYTLEVTYGNMTGSKETPRITLTPDNVCYITLHLKPDTIKPGTYEARILVRSKSVNEVKGVTVKAIVPSPSGPNYIMYVFIVGGFIIASIVVLRTEPAFVALLSLLIPLYYRVTRKDVLDNYIRGKIHGYIIANPGDHYNAIKEMLGINNGTLSYHLRVLEREKLIKSRIDGKYKRYYPYETKIPKKVLTPIQKRIVEKLEENPGISQRRLAKLLGESAQVVNYHMKILREASIVEIRPIGNRSECYVSSEWR